MAEFSKLVTTDGGRALLAALLAEGKQIEFTKVSTSDTVYEEAELAALEALTGIRQNGTVSKVTRATDTTVRIETVVTNAELTESYYIRTVGLYAKSKDGAEILYAVAVEKSGSCHMPAFAGTTVSGAYLNLITTVSNAENVSIEVSDSVYATIGDIKDLQEQIDGLRDMAEGNAALGELNGAKLDALERMGKLVLIEEISVGKEVPYDNGVELFRMPKTELAYLNDKTYYLFILDVRPGSAATVYDVEDMSGDLDGALALSLAVGTDRGAEQYFPISRSFNTLHTVPVSLMEVCGINPSSDEIVLSARPEIQEKTAEGTWVRPQGKLKIEASLRLRAFKLGYVLASISEGQPGTGGGSGGIRDYNVLNNKPSINNVTLKGNLTPAQLGLGAGGSQEELEEYTEEEILAALT